MKNGRGNQALLSAWGGTNVGALLDFCILIFVLAQ